MQIPVLVIFAPTATGKTALLRLLFGSGSPYFFKDRAEIINADSMQVYKYMDIGTAKPDKNLQKEIPHHLVDFCTPDKMFSASMFVEQADSLCREIYSRGKIPVVCGGTGFYIKSFLMGLPPTPTGNEEVRKTLQKRVETEGLESLYNELKLVDTLTAEKINPHDAYRIERALEVFKTTGRTLSSFKVPDKLRNEYDFCTLILGRGRQELYRRIDERVDQMFSSGLAEEFNMLLKLGFTEESHGMNAIGYREFFEYFPEGVPFMENGKFSEDILKKIESVKEKIKKNSRHYAKKQSTFMKGIPDSSFCTLAEGREISPDALKKISDFMAANT